MKTREQIFAELDHRLDVARASYMSGLMSLTAARIHVGTADWKERLAYRFPNLLGRLCERARSDRLAD